MCNDVPRDVLIEAFKRQVDNLESKLDSAKAELLDQSCTIEHLLSRLDQLEREPTFRNLFEQLKCKIFGHRYEDRRLVAQSPGLLKWVHDCACCKRTKVIVTTQEGIEL